MLSIRNAAGTAKTLADVKQLCNSAVTEITVGSITPEPRWGNGGTTTGFNEREGAYINALGLPNRGLVAFLKELPEMLDIAHMHGKKLVVSVAGFSPGEYALMANACYRAGADLVELNLGCPNVWGPHGRKPIPSYDFELTRDILAHTSTMLRPLGKKVSVKISPVPTDRLLSDIADALLYSDIVEEIVACNTLPDRELLLDTGAYALSYRSEPGGEIRHSGGLSGKPLKDVSLQIVGMLSVWLPEIRIIGTGGIFSGTDAQQYLNAGAAGFACAAAYMVYGPKIFGDIAAQLFA